MRQPRRRLLGIVAGAVAALTMWLAVAAPGALAAEPAAPAPVTVEDLEALAAAIKDDAKREELLTQIRALIEVAREAPPDEVETLGPRLVSTLSATAGEISRQVVALANRLSNLPLLSAWFERQVSDPAIRSLWLFALLKLAAVIAVGWLAERLAVALLTRPRRGVDGREAANLVVRLPLLLVRTVMEVVPIAAFAVAAYALLPLLNPARQTQVMVVTFLSAYVLIRVLTVLVRMLLVPPGPSLRLLSMGPETATYLFIWSRRLIATGVVGYYAAEAALLFGLPLAAHAGLLRVVGLLIAAMVVVFLLQNRGAVAERIRGRPVVGQPLTAAYRLRRRLADVWHVLAIVYVIGVFAVWALAIEGGFEYLFRATVASALILVAAKALAMALRRGIERGFAVGDDVKHRFPLLEARVNRYVPAIHLVLRAILYIVAGLALLQAWGLDTLGWLDSPSGRRVTGGAFSIGLVLVFALVLWEAVSSSIERYLTQTGPDGAVLQRSARARTLLPLLRTTVMVFLLVMVTLIVLSELGVNIGPLLAGAGVIGLAVGFGSQKLVQDVINGVFILVEDSLAAGDVVTAAGISGVVEQISIRSLRLRGLDGTVHTIPFSTVDTVSNMTKGFSMAVIEAGVAYRESVDEVMEVLKQLGAEMTADPTFGPLIIEPLEMLGVDALGDSAVTIKCRFKTVPLKQWTVGREFNRRMKNRFDELGIEIPFPHQTVYFGVDKQGKAPPVFVQTQDDTPPAAPPAPAAVEAETEKPDTPPTDPTAEEFK
ncbi:mechanosensitive ion channel domain-containing protein [Shumkonia mesophila]|uniref:mechanosensitive ion channel domain-containing protein n=1 Tax=Shumkonia mesophila TaxID=2838854 RepID=UPI0029349D31|nr:mechanosensitive ion channel domain-containing protein [Shumkonia mesophila]